MNAEMGSGEGKPFPAAHLFLRAAPLKTACAPARRAPGPGDPVSYRAREMRTSAPRRLTSSPSDGEMRKPSRPLM